MQEKEVKIGQESYTLKQFNLREQQEIRNEVVEVVAGPSGVERKIKAGDYQSLVLFHSLKSWSLKDEKGEPVEITLDNMYAYLPPAHFDQLFAQAEILNTVGEAEKNS